MAAAVPIVFGLVNASQSRAESQAVNTATQTPSFEVASIKPDKSDSGREGLMFTPTGLTAKNISLKRLIEEAYGVQDNEISGGPNWLDSKKYDIEAKVNGSAVDELSKLSLDQRKLMLQPLLADRIQLKYHRETKELPTYTLILAKNGPKLQESKSGGIGPGGTEGPHFMRITGRGQLSAQGVPLEFFVQMLSQQLGRQVLDKTGLMGTYDFTLQWAPAPDESRGPMSRAAEGGDQGPDHAPPPDSSGPSIFTAIQDQLGLKLESQKAPVEVLVIDHVETPSEN
jgi:uncharacterized protein (TIGR03435 family)